MKYLINDTYYHAYGGMIIRDGIVIGGYKRDPDEPHFYIVKVRGEVFRADRLGLALQNMFGKEKEK